MVSGQTANAQKAGGGAVPVAAGGKPAEPAGPAGLAPQTSEFSTYMTIQPDERSDAVVVSGTANDIRLLKELIERLDIALAQVRIQVVIAEVTLDDTDISGISSL